MGLLSIFNCGSSYKVTKSENSDDLLMDVKTQASAGIEFHNVSLTVPGNKRNEKKKILKNVSGQFKSGELTAIMGPSGAGKSSLLNVLTGFALEGTEGTIKVGGIECNLGTKQKCLKRYRKQSCYILQDDRLNPLFTVEEIMNIAADLKLGNALDASTKTKVINEVLETLSLSGTLKTRCGRLSGGQRKRLSVALELIDNPPVIFLDEPTTGLDSSASAQCVELLKNLARGGRTVVCTIHQPSAFVYELFDRVYVLADGVNVYEGWSQNTVEFFASVGLRCPLYHNPADFLLEVVNCEYGKFNEVLAIANKQMDWNSRKVKEKEDEKPAQLTTKNSREFSRTAVVVSPPSEIYKLIVLVRRLIIQMYRDWTTTHLKVFLHLLVGIILGSTFKSAGNNAAKTLSNLGYFMISVVYLCYTSLMPAVVKFPHELPVLRKEHFNNWYDLKTYYVANLLIAIPLQIIFSTVYCGPSYFLSGQPMEMNRLFMFLLVCSLVTLIADAIGNTIGTCVNAINGTFLGAILTCTKLVFAGYLVLFSHMSVIMRCVSQASFMRYALQGLVRSMYGYDRNPLPCPDDVYCHLKYPKRFLQELSMDEGYFWNDIYVLLGYLFLFRVLAYLTLARSMKRAS